jgi:hypothetical protein
MLTHAAAGPVHVLDARTGRSAERATTIIKVPADTTVTAINAAVG